MLIDGQYIEDLIPGYSTLQVSGRELLSQSIEKQTIGKSDGEFIQYVRNPSREIVVGYRLAAADNLSFRQAFYKLNSILHGDSHQVSFNDDPSKYWIATFSDIDDVPKGRNAITSSFTLFVPDGVAHSVATQTADNMPYKDVPVNLIPNSSTKQVIKRPEDNPSYPNWVGHIIYAGLKNNETYTFSALATAETTDKSAEQWGIRIFQSSGDHEAVAKILDANTGKRQSLTFTTPDDGISYDVWVYAGAIGQNYTPPDLKVVVTVSDYKLELGTSASPWSPNPADPEYYADTITVHNGGTYPVEPVITATMHSDNGVLALINEENGGVLQFGDAEQIDGEEKQKSEQVIHDTFSGGKPDSSLTANVGTVFFNDSGRSKIEGGFTSSETKDAVVPTFIGTSSDRWNGPTLHGDIPATAEGKNTGNFLFENRVNFTTAVGHNGRVEFILNSPDGVAMVFVLRDTITTKKQMVIEAWCMGEQLAQKVIDLGSFNSNFFDLQMGRIGSQLLFQIAKISKLNGDVPSYASKITMTPTFSKFADVPITSMTSWFSRFGNHEESDMAWTDSKFIWTDIAYWNDLANTFSSGDLITIDTENRGIALNGVNVSGLQSIDNDWGKFALLPGDNHISINYSSFAETPKVTATIREAFL